MVIEPNTQHHQIVIGPKLREQLRLELRQLLREWNFVGNSRRREIARELTLIYELLSGEDSDND